MGFVQKNFNLSTMMMQRVLMVSMAVLLVGLVAGTTTTQELDTNQDLEGALGPEHAPDLPILPVGGGRGSRGKRAYVVCRTVKYRVNRKSTCSSFCGDLDFSYFSYDYPTCECCY